MPGLVKPVAVDVAAALMALVKKTPCSGSTKPLLLVGDISIARSGIDVPRATLPEISNTWT